MTRRQPRKSIHDGPRITPRPAPRDPACLVSPPTARDGHAVLCPARRLPDGPAMAHWAVAEPAGGRAYAGRALLVGQPSMVSTGLGLFRRCRHRRGYINGANVLRS